MRELKVGDKVKVRSDLVVDKYYGCCKFNIEMEKCKNNIVTISDVYLAESKFYKTKENIWSWTPEMLEELIEPNPFLTDSINSPSHYLHGGIETIEVIRMMLTPEEFKGYCKGNIIKYRERAPYKGREEEDYAKARKYKEFLDGANKE